MSDSTRRIHSIAQRSLKRARNAFADAFGHSITDARINEELERLLIDAIGESSEVVEIPSNFVLALWLRTGGRAKGRRAQGTRERRFNELAVRTARKIKQELVSDGMQRGLATQKAATLAKERVNCRISAATIADRMSRGSAEKRSGK